MQITALMWTFNERIVPNCGISTQKSRILNNNIYIIFDDL